MKKTILALAVALSMPMAAAHADVTYPAAGSPACSTWDMSTGGWIQCRGSFDGNNSGSGNGGSAPGEAATLAYINQEWGGTYGSNGAFSLIGDQPFNVQSSTITFTQMLTGYNVIALKQAQRFSLYLFDFGDGANSMTFSTVGVQGANDDVSHVTAYSGGEGGIDECLPGSTDPDCNPVPEPASFGLVFAGLAGLGVVARRRRNRA